MTDRQLLYWMSMAIGFWQMWLHPHGYEYRSPPKTLH